MILIHKGKFIDIFNAGYNYGAIFGYGSGSGAYGDGLGSGSGFGNEKDNGLEEIKTKGENE